MPVKLKPLKKAKIEIVPPKVGEIVEGKVVSPGRSSLFLDLGPRGIGIIYGAEFYKAKEMLKDLKPGQLIKTKVVGLEDENGYRELSLTEATKEIAWKELRESKEKNEEIEIKIKKANKGGLMANVKGIPAFLPVSQLSPEHYPQVKDGDKNKIMKALQEFIGETLKVKVLSLNPKKENLILSEKLETPEKKNLENYKVGDKVEGKISGITSFGAFVDLDGIEALINKADISEEKKPEEVLKLGQKVVGKIKEISKGRLYLSLEK